MLKRDILALSPVKVHNINKFISYRYMISCKESIANDLQQKNT